MKVNNDETLYRYIRYYLDGVNGDSLAKRKAELLRLCLPNEYIIGLFRIRASIRDCSETRYCSELSKLLERSAQGKRVPLQSLHDSVLIEYR